MADRQEHAHETVRLLGQVPQEGSQEADALVLRRARRNVVDGDDHAPPEQRRIVLLGGEAGSGKSRLAREFAAEAAAAGVLVLYGAAWALQAAANGYALVFFSVLVGVWVLWFVVLPRRWTALALLRELGALAAGEQRRLAGRDASAFR